MKENSRQFICTLAVFQVIFIILFGFFVRYDENWADEQLNRNQFYIFGPNKVQSEPKTLPKIPIFRIESETDRNYAWLQDAHMCVTAGFGILLGYLKRFRYSGMGFNFFIAAFCYQWSILFQGQASI